MKVWDEYEVLEELVASRKAVAVLNNEKNAAKFKKRNQAGHNKISFLLILVRRYQHKCYEFVYFPSETYERIEGLFNNTAIVKDATSWTGSISVTDDEENDPSDCQLSSSSSDEEDVDCHASCLESLYVGKAIFHTVSGEPLMKIVGSPGWQEALKQKYRSLDANSGATTKEVEPNRKVRGGRKAVAAKAVAAAAIGGGAATGGTALAAGALGYTATGIAANSAAAAIMSAEAIATGGGVAAGGFTATMQTIGAVGVMASPVGMTLAAGGAIVGLGCFYWMHRHNQRKEAELGPKSNKISLIEKLSSQNNVAEEAMAKVSNQYLPLDENDDKQGDKVDLWVIVTAKKIAMEESDHFFDYSSWEEHAEAEKAFQDDLVNTAAKALFDPHGVLVQLDADPTDMLGWEVALQLHYGYLVEQDKLPMTQETHGEGTTEDSPLLASED